MRPASENTTDDSNTIDTVMNGLTTVSRVKARATRVTRLPTRSPRMTPPATCPRMIVPYDIGDTSISSMCRPNFAPKKDETTLP